MRKLLKRRLKALGVAMAILHVPALASAQEAEQKPHFTPTESHAEDAAPPPAVQQPERSPGQRRAPVPRPRAPSRPSQASEEDQDQ
jgi:hypothetical protein